MGVPGIRGSLSMLMMFLVKVTYIVYFREMFILVTFDEQYMQIHTIKNEILANKRDNIDQISHIYKSPRLMYRYRCNRHCKG